MSFLAQFQTAAPDRGYDNAVIEAELAKVRNATQGTRNRTLNDAAFNLLQVYPLDTVREPLLAAAQYAGLDRTEANATILSAHRGAERNPRPAHRLPRTDKINRPLVDLPSIDGWTEPAPEPALIDWEALWADPGRVEWLSEPLIPVGRLVSLYSPPGVGKSLLALQVAAAIASGAPVLGGPTRRTPVLYLDYENVALDVRDRLLDMGLGPADLTGLHYWSFPEIPPLDTPEGGKALVDQATKNGAGLVVIDTLSRCVQGEENEASTMLNMYRCTLMPLKAKGIAVLRLDHTGKDENKGQRGTSAKSGDVDLVWRLSEVIPEETFLLSNEKHRIRISETRLNIKREHDPLRHRVDTRTVGQTKTEAVLEALDEAGLPLNAGRDRARAIVTARGIRIADKTLSDLLRRRQGLPDLSE